MKDGDTERTFFVGVFKMASRGGVAFETFGKGYGGDVGLMVGINVKRQQTAGSRGHHPW